MEEDKGKQIKYDKYGYRIENLDNYKPKKYYIEPENEEELEKALKTHEDYMKQFKYHEDIPMYFFLYIYFNFI